MIWTVSPHDRFEQISLSFPQSPWLIPPAQISSGPQHVQGWTTSAHRADEYSMTQKGIILAQ